MQGLHNLLLWPETHRDKVVLTWFQTADVTDASPPGRWIKFEEKVEKGGERWSKPHVATLSLHSLFELRTCIEKGTIMLDMEASSLPQVVGR